MLPGKTVLLTCVDEVFWNELEKCLITNFFLKSLFLEMLGILPTAQFVWLKRTALRTSSKSCSLLTTVFPLNEYLNSACMHVGSPRVDTWNRMRPLFVALLQSLLQVENCICVWLGSTCCHGDGPYSSVYSQWIFHLRFQKKKDLLRKICIKDGDHLEHYCCHLVVESFFQKMNLTNKVLLFFGHKKKTWPRLKKWSNAFRGNVTWKWSNKKTP